VNALSGPVYGDITAARHRIASLVHETPVATCNALDRICGASVFLKCENLQRTGSFKFRGASNAIASLSAAERARGVITHSSGNHAQALALAADLHGVHATVVIPEDAPRAKREAAAAYGATVVSCPPTQEGRRETTRRLIEETGAVFIDSHDAAAVIAGQATAAVELIEAAGPFDVLLTPVGGGGLLSGSVLAAEALLPQAQVIGCEPQGADDAYRSLRDGERIAEVDSRTIADGLKTSLGERTFGILLKHKTRIVLVSEEQIVQAMRFVWERMKLVIEPSSAVAVAPLLSGTLSVSDRRVGVILSGGNVSLDAVFEAMYPKLAA
jgi:threonine dehydratase